MLLGSQLQMDLAEGMHARTLAASAAARYPTSAAIVANQARILWRDGAHSEASYVLAKTVAAAGRTAWREHVAETSREVFGGKDTKDAVTAFKQLVSARIGPERLYQIVRVVGERHPRLAFELSKQVRLPGLDNLHCLLESYAYLKKVDGVEAATKWLEAQVPKPLRLPLSQWAYGAQRFEVLWSVVPDVESTDRYTDFVWLMRAAAVAHGAKVSREQRRALREHYEGEGSSYYHTIGRYLVGLAGREEVFALADSLDRGCEVAYYVGLGPKSQRLGVSNRRWFRVATELCPFKEGEGNWALTNLWAHGEHAQKARGLKKK